MCIVQTAELSSAFSLMQQIKLWLSLKGKSSNKTVHENIIYIYIATFQCGINDITESVFLNLRSKYFRENKAICILTRMGGGGLCGSLTLTTIYRTKEFKL